MKIKFKKLRENAVIPTRATAGSAGLDIYACVDGEILIDPGEIVKIPTGIASQPDTNDIAMFVYPRSGLSSNHGVTLVNCVGVIDADYRGEWQIPLINHGREPFKVTDGMRIAQLIPMQVIPTETEETDSLDDTDRGTGGFGSSGN